MTQAAHDHNHDIAMDIHLNSVEERLSDDRRTKARELAEVVGSLAWAVRESQRWQRTLAEEVASAHSRLAGVDGRLRRLEAAAAADDAAIDDLRTDIDDLTADLDPLVNRQNPETR